MAALRAPGAGLRTGWHGAGSPGAGLREWSLRKGQGAVYKGPTSVPLARGGHARPGVRAKSEVCALGAEARLGDLNAQATRPGNPSPQAAPYEVTLLKSAEPI